MGTGKVTDMYGMFCDASPFTSDLSEWQTGNVMNMNGMFKGASSFNSDLSKWQTGNVTDMCGMFGDATAFTSDLSKWQTGNVTDMREMFNGASSFNSDLSEWDTGKVTNMKGMFYGAVALQQKPLWYARWEEEDHGLGYERWWIHGPEDVFRECNFQLCTGDCIYADFFADDDSAVKLLRISFDGYGCCDCTNVNMMDENDAKELLAWVNARRISDQDRCDKIMARYCTQNKEVIWEDALKEYELFVYDD